MFELRISVIAKDANGGHTKHVAIEITNAALAGAIVKLISETGKVDIAGAGDAQKIELA